MIAYSDQGRGNPIVLIHGFCETKNLWSSLEASLTQSYRVISVDLPGFGESERLLEENTSIESLADAVLQLLSELGIEQSILVGHSLGGYVALAMIEQKPDCCAGLCMFHSTAFADTEEKKLNRDKTLDFIQRQGVASFITAFVPSLFYPDLRESLAQDIQQLQSEAMKTPLFTINEVTLAMRNRKNRIAVIENLSAPVLYIVGKNDLAVPYEMSEKQMLLAPKSEALVLDETGHMGMLERKKETSEAVIKFANHCYA